MAWQALMSRNEHFANGANEQRYVRLWRGLNQTDASAVSHESLGIHWTDDPQSAVNFALNRDMDGWPREGAEEYPESGTVLEALVHKRNIVQRGTPEWDEYAEANNIHGDWSRENETTIRYRAPVHVVRVHRVGDHYEDAMIRDMPAQSGRA